MLKAIDEFDRSYIEASKKIYADYDLVYNPEIWRNAAIVWGWLGGEKEFVFNKHSLRKGLAEIQKLRESETPTQGAKGKSDELSPHAMKCRDCAKDWFTYRDEAKARYEKSETPAPKRLTIRDYSKARQITDTSLADLKAWIDYGIKLIKKEKT